MKMIVRLGAQTASVSPLHDAPHLVVINVKDDEQESERRGGCGCAQKAAHSLSERRIHRKEEDHRPTVRLDMKGATSTPTGQHHHHQRISKAALVARIWERFSLSLSCLTKSAKSSPVFHSASRFQFFFADLLSVPSSCCSFRSL